MSKPRKPRNTALGDALKAAVKSSAASGGDEQASTPADSRQNIFRSVFEPDPKFISKDAKPRVRKARRKVRRPKRKRLQKRSQEASYASIRAAYGSVQRSKPSQERKAEQTQYDIEKPFHLSRALVQTSVTGETVSWLYKGSRDTQFKLIKGSGCIDIVMGIDFGTTFTKVVLRELGSRRSWAVPFTNSKKNPYLLQGGACLEQGFYRPVVNNDLSIGSLKLPFLDGSPVTEEHFARTAAYLAYVIAHTRQWFLETKESQFQRFAIDWTYHIGIPASSYSNEELVQTFEDLLDCALKLSMLVDDEGAGIYSSQARRIAARLDRAEPYEEIVEDCADLRVYPEIAAQLHGYVMSDRWDSERRKFMLVDIGSGTVDATMVNVTQSEDERRYVFLKTMVTPNGTLMLHRNRLERLRKVAPRYPNGGGEALESMEGGVLGLGSWRYVPDHISEYLEAPYDEHVINNFDHRFRIDYQKRVTELLIQAKKTDPRFNHKDLPIILCGGGSQNSLYSAYLDLDLSQVSVSFKPIPVLAPRGLDMTAASTAEFHRLSVAYGLAYEELATVIGEEALENVDIDIGPSEERRFISKDDV